MLNAENGCRDNNGGCSQLCVTTRISHYCDCRSGYRLAADNHSCEGMYTLVLLTVIPVKVLYMYCCTCTNTTDNDTDEVKALYLYYC